MMFVVADFLNSPRSVGTWTLVPERSTIRFENTTITATLPLQAGVELLEDCGLRLRTKTKVKRQQFAVEGNMLGMAGAKSLLKPGLVFQRMP